MSYEKFFVAKSNVSVIFEFGFNSFNSNSQIIEFLE